MKTSIPSLYAEYGRYSDSFRAIPYYMDCLKPVERRVLLSLYDEARTKFMKSARIIGASIGKYHPHGDASTYGSLVSLVHRHFAVPQGNFGSINLRPPRYAAPRYTEAKLEPFVDKFAFELIKFVPWSDPENLQTDQPDYLTSPIPLGLIGEGLTTGISFNTTKIPRYNLPDLIKRLEYLFKKEYDPNLTPETIVPYFPNFDVYETEQGSFEKILTTGIGSITIVPKMKIDRQGVWIYGKPPSGVSTWVKENNIYDIIDLSSGTFEVLFSPKSGPVNQHFVDIIFKLVTTKINFICNVINSNETVELMSIDQLILNGYNIWLKHLGDKYNLDLSNIRKKLFNLKVVAIIRDIINTENVQLNKVDQIINIFTQKYKTSNPDITENHIKECCSKHSIKALIEYKLDTQSLVQQEKEVLNILNNLTIIGYNHMKDFLK